MRASDVAYDRLRQEIIGWVLKPGDPLGEIETAARLGVSRTPLREALARLAAEGLVETAARTATVAQLSRQHVVELFELREALESQSARLAAHRRDRSRFEELLNEFEPTAESKPDTDPQRPYLLASALDAAIDEAA